MTVTTGTTTLKSLLERRYFKSQVPREPWIAASYIIFLRVSMRKTETEDCAVSTATALCRAVEGAIRPNQCACRMGAVASRVAPNMVEHDFGPVTARARGWYQF